MRKVAFICIHNSCRSQMAEGWSKHLFSDLFETYSAGTEDYPGPKLMAIEVMKDAGVDMSLHTSKLLTDIPEVDIVITMGCGVECPVLPCDYREDWGLDDPSGGPKSGFEETRDLIKGKVKDLAKRISEGL